MKERPMIYAEIFHNKKSNIGERFLITIYEKKGRRKKFIQQYIVDELDIDMQLPAAKEETK